MPAPSNPIQSQYKRLTELARKIGVLPPEVGSELLTLCDLCLDFIRTQSEMAELTSKVPGKRYMMARSKIGTRASRPINIDLFNIGLGRGGVQQVLSGDVGNLSESALQRDLYTVAMSYPVARDLAASGDRKSPGTYFEVLIGHIVAHIFGVSPTTSIEIPSLDIENTLPTDFIFSFGPGEPRIHMPTKISTRERVVQAWAHQKVLEGMHGAGRFLGMMVILTETNKQESSGSVVEVCLPGQWAAYQMYISRMHRIYYLDMPTKYEALRLTYPFVPVWPFSRFFREHAEIRSGPID